MKCLGVSGAIQGPSDARRCQVTDEGPGPLLGGVAVEKRVRAELLGLDRPGLFRRLTDIAEPLSTALKDGQTVVRPDYRCPVVMCVDVAVSAVPAALLGGEPAMKVSPQERAGVGLRVDLDRQRHVVGTATQLDSRPADRHPYGELTVSEEAFVGIDTPVRAIGVLAVRVRHDDARRKRHPRRARGPGVVHLDRDLAPSLGVEWLLPHGLEPTLRRFLGCRRERPGGRPRDRPTEMPRLRETRKQGPTKPRGLPWVDPRRHDTSRSKDWSRRSDGSVGPRSAASGRSSFASAQARRSRFGASAYLPYSARTRPVAGSTRLGNAMATPWGDEKLVLHRVCVHPAFVDGPSSAPYGAPVHSLGR